MPQPTIKLEVTHAGVGFPKHLHTCRAGFSMAIEYQLRDHQLHAHIRRRIDEGRLPVCLPDSIRAGYGSGSKCHACDQLISHSEIEYDVQDPTDSTARLRLHLGCYVLWQTECARRSRAERRDSLLGQTLPPSGSSKKVPGTKSRARMPRHP